MAETALVFGASGALGQAVVARFMGLGIAVARGSRSARTESGWLDTSVDGWASSLEGADVTRVVWAQGANASGSVLDESVNDLEGLFQANVVYVVQTLQNLLERDLLSESARLCIVSSIWQNIARDNKLAYVTTKAAVGGLVRSLAADLGPRGIAVNAVLPGVVDSPMTRQFVSTEVLSRIEHETPLRRLVRADEVANVVEWLTGPGSSGVTGQSLVVDQGWSEIRYV